MNCPYILCEIHLLSLRDGQSAPMDLLQPCNRCCGTATKRKDGLGSPSRLKFISGYTLPLSSPLRGEDEGEGNLKELFI